MPQSAGLSFPTTIAALAASLSIFSLLPVSSPAGAAESCLAAPKSAASAGSHWFYRLDRATQRKCWRLVQQDKKAPGATARTAPQPESDVEQAAPPVASTADRPAEPERQAPAWITKNVSDTSPNTFAPLPNPAPANAAPAPEAAAAAPAAESAPSVMPDRGTPVEPPAPPVTVAAENASVAPASGGTRMLQFAFAALAAGGLLTCAILYLVGRRRKADVLSVARDTELVPFESAAVTGPTFAALPPMELIRQHDDVDEALQRFSQSWKRRAA